MILSSQGVGKKFSKTTQNSPTHCLVGGLLGFGLYWVFQIFYLNEQLGSLLVDLAHQLSFYLDLPVP